MSALRVLMAGVCLVLGLQANDIPSGEHPSDWNSKRDIARTAMQRQDYAEASRLYDECVTAATNVSQRVTSLADYGIALSRAGRNAEAKSALEQALAAQGLLSDHDRMIVAGVTASVDRSLGDYQGAERMLRSAIGDANAPARDRVAMMVNLADLLREEFRADEAGQVLNDAAQVSGLTRQQRVSLLVETAELSRDMQLWTTSLGLWNKLSQIADEDKNVEWASTAAGGMGATWYAAGNFTRAEPLLRRSLGLLRENPSTPEAQVATALGRIACLYIDEDKLALADEAIDEAIAKDEEALGKAHPQVALLLETRAQALSRRGDARAAREVLERARAIMSDRFGPESTAVAGVMATLGDVDLRDNKAREAVAEYESALRMLRVPAGDSARFESALSVRYAAALKAAHLSGRTIATGAGKTITTAGRTLATGGTGEAQALLAPSVAQSFREK